MSFLFLVVQQASAYLKCINSDQLETTVNLTVKAKSICEKWRAMMDRYRIFYKRLNCRISGTNDCRTNATESGWHAPTNVCDALPLGALKAELDKFDQSGE